jgi:hypothetical protein
LIVQEPGESCTDDSVDGGIITFDFPFGSGNMSRRLVSWTLTMKPLPL